MKDPMAGEATYMSLALFSWALSRGIPRPGMLITLTERTVGAAILAGRDRGRAGLLLWASRVGSGHEP